MLDFLDKLFSAFLVNELSFVQSAFTNFNLNHLTFKSLNEKSNSLVLHLVFEVFSTAISYLDIALTIADGHVIYVNSRGRMSNSGI